MKFTTIDITPALEQMLSGGAKLYDKAPESQKRAVSVQIRENMLTEIKRQGKIYISEQTAVKTLVERNVKTALAALKDANGAFSDLKKLKNKPKNASEIQALVRQITAGRDLIAARNRDNDEAKDGLVAHQGWRSSAKKVPADAEAERVLGKANIDSLQKDYEKIQGAGVALYGPVATIASKGAEAEKAADTILKAAKTLASGLMDQSKSEDFAGPILEELNGTSNDGLKKLAEDVDAEGAGAETSYGAVQNLLKDKKVTAKDMAANYQMQTRVIEARRKKFDGIDARLGTIKTKLYTVTKLAKRAPLSPELAAQYKAATSQLKTIEKALTKGKKTFEKQIKLVEKDMKKAAGK